MRETIATPETSQTREISRTLAERLARSIVRCYPYAWRMRYGAEALDVLALRSPTCGDLGNLAYHALYTWLHPDLIADEAGSTADGLTALMDLIRSVRMRELAMAWTRRRAGRRRRRRVRSEVSSHADLRPDGDEDTIRYPAPGR